MRATAPLYNLSVGLSGWDLFAETQAKDKVVWDSPWQPCERGKHGAGSARSAAHLCFTGWADEVGQEGGAVSKVFFKWWLWVWAVEHHIRGVNLSSQVFIYHGEFDHFQPWKDGDDPDEKIWKKSGKTPFQSPLFLSFSSSRAHGWQLGCGSPDCKYLGERFHWAQGFAVSSWGYFSRKHSWDPLVLTPFPWAMLWSGRARSGLLMSPRMCSGFGLVPGHPRHSNHGMSGNFDAGMLPDIWEFQDNLRTWIQKGSEFKAGAVLQLSFQRLTLVFSLQFGSVLGYFSKL